MKCSNPSCPRPNVVESEQGLICDTCGAVAQEDSGLVSEQGFGETDSGRITALGVHVGESQTHQRTYAPGGALGNAGREPTVNRERSEAHARTIMISYQTLLKIRSAEVEAGMQIFKLAWGNSFVQGRTIDSVAVVCLYLACRRKHEQVQNERRPLYSLMMIDFAERLNMDVFALGKMYHDLVRRLYGQSDSGGIQADISADLLAHGPEVLVSRFVDALEFDKAHRDKIKMDAIRIVKRMKRDWMSTGRRPSGVCGAAILLAARMNNYRRTVREVVLTAKVTEITINKRLEEFSDTQSSKLSVTQFRDNSVLDAVVASDPPSYQRAHNPQSSTRKKRGRPRKRPLPETAAELEADAEPTRNADASHPPAKRPRLDAEGFAIPEIPQRPTPIDPAITGEAVPASASGENAISPAIGRPRGAKNWSAPPPSEAELAIEKEIRKDIAQTFRENEELAPEYQYMAEDDDDDDENPTDETEGTTSTPPAPASDQPSVDENSNLAANEPNTTGRTPSPAPSAPPVTSGTPKATAQRTKSGPAGPAVNTNAGNTGIISLSPTLKPDEFDDDEDVSACLLSDAESRIKERVWVSMNADWLRQDHAKRIKRELKEAEMRSRGLDPAKEALKQAQSKGRRKDGTKKPGRRGDVSYLNDKDKARGDAEGAAGGEGEDVKNGGADRERSAADSVRKMFEARGTYSTRVNYAVLESIYGIAGDESDSSRAESRSRSASVQPGDREGSVASSVASASGAGNIFRGNAARDSGRQRGRASQPAERRDGKKKDQQQERRDRSESVATSVQDDEAHEAREASDETAADEADHPQQQQQPTPSPTQQQPLSVPSVQPATTTPPSSIKPTAGTSKPSSQSQNHTPDLPDEEALGPVASSQSPTRREDEDEEVEDEDEADGEISLLRERDPGEYEDESEGDEDDYVNEEEEDNYDDEDGDNGGDEDVDAAFEGRYHPPPGRSW
jgi:transcription factor IIIB subunit 2